MKLTARRAAALSLSAFVAALALAPAALKAQPSGAPPPVLPGASSREPVEIDAENLQWRDAERIAVYTGRVVVTQGETTLHAARLRVQLGKADAAAASAKQGASLLPGAPAVSDIRRIEADGPVTIIQKDQIGSGDRGEYDKTADRVILAGHVVLTQSENATSGARLVYRIARRDVTVEGGRGRVRSHFVPGGKPQDSARPGKPVPPPPAAQPAPGADAFPGAGSSREPIQIEANRLDWSDAARRAVYSGAVTAVQGDAALRASRLTIYIDPADKAAGGANPAGGGRIRRIVAEGGVTVMQKDQVITGSRAVYDRAANRIDMYGRVLATQGANVTRGPHLVYDLATKRAVMVGGSSVRAQAVFTPGENDAAAPASARAGDRRGAAR